MKGKKTIVALMCIALLASCTQQKGEVQKEEALSVVTEKAALSSDYTQLPYVGVVQEESSTMVSFSGMGVLKSLAVSEGQKVQKGQFIAAIDDAQAKSALEAAKAALDQALDAEARMKQLHEANSLPDMKWIEVESRVQQAKASYDMCKKSVDDCKVYAPVSGVVGSKIMGVGETALPAEPVLTILHINTVRVQVSIPEKEISSIGTDMASTISIEALGGASFQGGKIEKGVSADPLTHTYNIYIHLPNPDMQLLPGMVATVRFADNTQPAALTVPVKAVQKGSGHYSHFVWINDGGKAKRVSVSLGQTVGNRTTVTDGSLREGMEVVVQGYQKLSEGTLIKNIANTAEK